MPHRVRAHACQQTHCRPARATSALRPLFVRAPTSTSRAPTKSARTLSDPENAGKLLVGGARTRRAGHGRRRRRRRRNRVERPVQVGHRRPHPHGRQEQCDGDMRCSEAYQRQVATIHFFPLFFCFRRHTCITSCMQQHVVPGKHSVVASQTTGSGPGAGDGAGAGGSGAAHHAISRQCRTPEQCRRNDALRLATPLA